MDNKINFKNNATIFLEKNKENKIIMEIAYKKNNSILIRKVTILQKNIIPILQKLKDNNFIINRVNNDMNSMNDMYETLIPQCKDNSYHPEYRNYNMNNFVRQSYNASYKQKFSTIFT